jgi:hypothetical protein
MYMKSFFQTLLFSFLFTFCSMTNWAQNEINTLSKDVQKGSYAILEVRLNMEDEFRTVEGRDNEGLSRIALFTGQNKEKEILNKGFNGFNDVVVYLNEMKKNGWLLIETYTIKGNSLIITHYVFEKKK